MKKALTSLMTVMGRWLKGPQGVNIEERRWQRSIAALQRDCEGLEQRIARRQQPEEGI